MSKITKQNVGGTDYTMVGCALTGVCATSAADFVKVVTLSDGDVVSDGMTVVVTFANGNTAGNAPASQTIYSSDQVNYFSDSGLTQPFTLAPSGCYTVEYTGTGNAYTYTSYPVIQIGNVSAPLCTTDGKPAGGVVWTAGSSVSLLYTLGKFLVLPSARLTPYCTSANTTVSGGPLVSGGSVKIMFTSALTSANTTTALVLNYNGVNITVKVPRNGSLVDYKASAVSSVNYFCQAYTTLELLYNGTNFIIVGNPVIYSDADTTIYADGLRRVNVVTSNDKNIVTSGGVANYYGANKKFISWNSANIYSSGYILLAEISHKTGGNHDVGFSGIAQICPAGTITNVYFQGFIRAGGGSVNIKQFTINYLGGGKYLYLSCFYEVTDTNNIIIRLYGDVATWLKYNVYFDSLLAGDVAEPVNPAVNNVTFPLTVTSTRVGTEISPTVFNP